jgi:NADPH:quinone reductase-like Zn-dependent oxidoreductase/acyl carrier protein
MHDAEHLAAYLADASAGDEDEILLAGGRCYAHRLEFLDRLEAAASVAEDAAYALSLPGPGSLLNLAWYRVPKRPPERGEIQIAVQASALNFKDVLLTSGVLPADLLKEGPAGIAVGLECAGVVSAVGPEVTGFAIGDRVAAFAVGGFASTLTVPAIGAVHIPRRLGFADAATMPTVFATAWYALHHLARLGAGEVVLVHGGAGGVGLAAIQIAQQRGARIIATAGSEAKRDFLRRLGVDHVLDSRGTAFADEVRKITGGVGVDVALNSLAGDAMLATLSTLRPFGRFLEIGKRDLVENRKLGLRALVDDLDQVFTHRPEMLSALLAEVMALAETGVLRPLPRELYPPTRVVEAFRHMQASRHIGKLVVDHTMPPRPRIVAPPSSGRLRFDDGGTILVTGGTRGFGLAVARWLAARGAPCIALLGRSGTVAEEDEPILEAMRQDGARLELFAADAANENDLERALGEIDARGLPKLTGVFHAAVSYADKVVLSLTPADAARVIAPKAGGAWLLDRLTREMKLRHFVLFSSIAATLGSEGQAAYAAANSYLDALVARRRAAGLPGLAVNWGAIGGVGQVARNAQIRERMVGGSGLELLAVADAMAALETAMKLDLHQIGIGSLPRRALQSWQDARPTRRLQPVLAVLQEQAGEGKAVQGDVDWRAEATEEARYAAFRDLVQFIVRETLGFGGRAIDTTLTIGELGADSLLALQLVRAVERRLRVNFPDFRLLQSKSVDEFTALLFERASRTEAV